VTPLAERAFFFYVHDRFFTLIANYNGTFPSLISS
jgi:hypothetical protein